MASTGHSPPRSPDEWIQLAKRELGNLSGSYKGKLSNDAKVMYALMATEHVLKALIWKHEKWNEWPRTGKGGLNFLYKHDLKAMLDRVKLTSKLEASPEHRASWQVLLNAAVKQSRYSPMSLSDNEANEVAKCTRHPDIGVVPWLLNRYRETR